MATTLLLGKIKATIWQNVNENGPFFATTFSPPFKDQSGVWRNHVTAGADPFMSRSMWIYCWGAVYPYSKDTLVDFN